MESRYNQLTKDVSESVIQKFSIEIPHDQKKYNLNLTHEQTNTIRSEIRSTLNSLELSTTQKNILDKFIDDKEFKADLVGSLSFTDKFSVFLKYEHVKKSGLTGLYYDNLIFELAEFNAEKFWKTWPLKYFGSAKSPEKDLQMRFNNSTAGARKEFIIAVYCITIANFGTHDDHVALADELKNPNNKIIAAMRKPYGSISFFSSAKEINSKAYFAYQHHIFTTLLGAEVLTQAFEDNNLVLDVGRQISFLVKEKDVNSLACINRKTSGMAHALRERYAELYYRKRI